MWDPIFPLYTVKIAKNRGTPLFLETTPNGTEIFFHKDLILLREPYAGIEGSYYVYA